VSTRRALTGGVLAACLVLGGAACADTTDDSGATTNLDDVGPDLAKLRLEVQHLREEVRALQEEVLLLTPDTDPETGLPSATTDTTVPAG
jgi:hypothetical protein